MDERAELRILDTGLPALDVGELDRRSREQIAQHFRAANTRASYESAWAQFAAFCASVGRAALPAEPSTVRLYIQYCVDAREPRLSLRSVAVHLAAINFFHRFSERESPTKTREVEMAWEATRRAPRARTVGRGPKRALRAEHLRPLVSQTGTRRPIDVRDRALLVVGFLSGRRRSEIAGMTVDSVAFEGEGLVYRIGVQERTNDGTLVRVERSKTNQFGDRVERVFIPRGQDIEIDPVTLLSAWYRVGHIREGWVWRSLSNRNFGEPLDPESIRLIVQRRVLDALVRWLDEHAHDDPEVAILRDKRGRFVRSRFTPTRMRALVQRFALPSTFDPAAYGAHSLRSGFVTTAREKGRTDHRIMDQTGHRTARMMDEYTHSKDAWKDNAADGLLER